MFGLSLCSQHAAWRLATEFVLGIELAIDQSLLHEWVT